MNELFAPLSDESLSLLHSVPALIDKTFPLPGRFRAGLPADVAELSRLMTSSRGERDVSYLSRPNHQSAYLRYFLPWNIFRLCKLLPNLNISLAPGDTIVDLGCGPLSFASALWISRPDLRKIPLEFRCIDRTAPVLEAGRKFFAELANTESPHCPWKIITIRGSINPTGTIRYNTGKKPAKGKPNHRQNFPGRGRPAALVCAVNVFNEIHKNISPSDKGGMKKAAINSAQLLDSFTADSASILVVEPGVPFSGEFISCLRDELTEMELFPLSPCPHCGSCPIPGGGSGTGKKRWCHFAFDTGEAPPALHRLSAAAGIPKERAVLSFLYAVSGQISRNKYTEAVRVISDAFPVADGKFGRYGCSGQGLILVTGKRAEMETCDSGALINAVVQKNGERDSKSGALLASIK